MDKTNFYSGTAANSDVPCAPVTPRQMTEIDSANEELDREISQLHSVLSNLEMRLSPVVRVTPSEAAKRSDPPPTSVPLADTMRRFSFGIAQARDRIGVLLETVAL